MPNPAGPPDRTQARGPCGSTSWHIATDSSEPDTDRGVAVPVAFRRDVRCWRPRPWPQTMHVPVTGRPDGTFGRVMDNPAAEDRVDTFVSIIEPGSIQRGFDSARPCRRPCRSRCCRVHSPFSSNSSAHRHGANGIFQADRSPSGCRCSSRRVLSRDQNLQHPSTDSRRRPLLPIAPNATWTLPSTAFLMLAKYFMFPAPTTSSITLICGLR